MRDIFFPVETHNQKIDYTKPNKNFHNHESEEFPVQTIEMKCS